MITMKEARRIHRNTQTHVDHVPSGYRDSEGNMLTVKVRTTRIAFRKWVRNAWRLDLRGLNEPPSPKLARILRGAP